MSDPLRAETLYFRNKGKENTQAVLEIACRRAKELGLRKVLIATCTGGTAQRALDYFDRNEIEMVAVTHVTGFSEPNVQEMPEQTRNALEAKGVRVLTAAHAFGGVGRGVRNKLKSFQVDEILAFALRTLGQGVKVGVEIALTAADRGWVRTDEDVLTIAGTGEGADTAMIVQPSNSHTCLDVKIREIIAKPWDP